MLIKIRISINKIDKTKSSCNKLWSCLAARQMANNKIILKTVLLLQQLTRANTKARRKPHTQNTAGLRIQDVCDISWCVTSWVRIVKVLKHTHTHTLTHAHKHTLAAYPLQHQDPQPIRDLAAVRSEVRWGSPCCCYCCCFWGPVH